MWISFDRHLSVLSAWRKVREIWKCQCSHHHVVSRYDPCALGLSPVEERLSTLCEASSPQPAERMNGLESGVPPRRIVLHASVWTSSFGLMFPLRSSFRRECFFSFLRLYLESFSTQVGARWRHCGHVWSRCVRLYVLTRAEIVLKRYFLSIRAQETIIQRNLIIYCIETL